MSRKRKKKLLWNFKQTNKKGRQAYFAKMSWKKQGYSLNLPLTTDSSELLQLAEFSLRETCPVHFEGRWVQDGGVPLLE
jgi:hypothetical protein